MSEYKVIVSSSPHIRDPLTVSKIMKLVFIALLPAAIWGIYSFGIQALLIILTSIFTAVLSEYLYEIITRQKITIGDWSAVVTGLLLGMITSPFTPLWMIAIGSACAIIIAKQLFGGIGSNFVNPALFGRAVIFLSWTGILNRWTLPRYSFFTTLSQVTNSATQIVTSPTPLDLFRTGQLKITSSLYLDLFFGRIGGSIGETSKFLLIVGFIFLILVRRDIIDIKIPISIILSLAIISLIFKQDPLFHIYLVDS